MTNIRYPQISTWTLLVQECEYFLLTVRMKIVQSRTCQILSWLGLLHNPVKKGGHGKPSCAFLLITPHRSRNIKMSPGNVFVDKLRQTSAIVSKISGGWGWSRRTWPYPWSDLLPTCFRKRAAVIEPPGRPPVFTMSAMLDFIISQ